MAAPSRGVSYGLVAARVLILAFGTQGDVRPFVALAKGLRAAGHHWATCTSQSASARRRCVAGAAVLDADESVPDPVHCQLAVRWLCQQVELSVQSVHCSGLQQGDQLVPATNFGIVRDEPGMTICGSQTAVRVLLPNRCTGGPAPHPFEEIAGTSGREGKGTASKLVAVWSRLTRRDRRSRSGRRSTGLGAPPPAERRDDSQRGNEER